MNKVFLGISTWLKNHALIGLCGNMIDYANFIIGECVSIRSQKLRLF